VAGTEQQAQEENPAKDAWHKVAQHGSFQCAILCVSFLAMIALHWRLLSAGLFWDDEKYIFRNEVIQHGQNPLLFWGREDTSRSWPIFYTLMWAQFQLFGYSFSFYHCVNLFFHSLNGFLLYRIARKSDIPFPALPTAFFWLHPASFEAVSWIMQLSKILSLTFLLLWCLLCLRRPQTVMQNFLALFAACLSAGQGILILFSRLGHELANTRSWQQLAFWGVRALCAGYLIYLLVLGAAVHYEKQVYQPPAPPPSAPAPSPPTEATTSPTPPVPEFSPPPSAEPVWQRPSAFSYFTKLVQGEEGANKHGGWATKLSIVGQTFLHYSLRIAYPAKERIPVGWAPFSRDNPAWSLALGALVLILTLATLVKKNFLFLSLALLAYLPVSGLAFFPFMTISPVADRYLYIPLAFVLLFFFRFVPRRPKLMTLFLLCLIPLGVQSYGRAAYLERVFQVPFKSMFWSLEP
jgi:hypothetical protein